MDDVGRGRYADEAPRPTHPLSDGPLPFRTVMDAGIVSYDEFACSHSTLSWLLANGIPSDARLQVVEECRGGHNVIVKAWPR
jgi:hypothetical protein